MGYQKWQSLGTVPRLSFNPLFENFDLTKRTIQAILEM